ncbi:MAG: adenine-specific methyltransferase EcoRI family protein, partial [Candidatus Ornithospirochaeta sp.]
MAEAKPKNSALHRAKEAKADEFYTQLVDIEKELMHYTKEFEGKVVFCNCDDPYESNFFKYFAMTFKFLKLKKLICTCYDGSPFAGEQLDLFSEPNESNSKHAYKVEITEIPDLNNDGAVDLADVETLLRSDRNVLTLLKGNGDFRSDECIELLKQSDIVVTNPPFSLFREYVSQLVQYKKKFLIIGNQNAITYKEIFPLIANNQIWLGHALSYIAFRVPDYYEEKSNRFWIDEKGCKWRSLGNACWFTNLDFKERHEPLVLYKHYTPEEYPKYDNYDAINVDKVSDIPCDYFEDMGVPITFLDKHNPEQFDIVDANTIRTSENVPVKGDGLIKDKEASIKLDNYLTYTKSASQFEQ